MLHRPTLPTDPRPKRRQRPSSRRRHRPNATRASRGLIWASIPPLESRFLSSFPDRKPAAEQLRPHPLPAAIVARARRFRASRFPAADFPAPAAAMPVPTFEPSADGPDFCSLPREKTKRAGRPSPDRMPGFGRRRSCTSVVPRAIWSRPRVIYWARTAAALPARRRSSFATRTALNSIAARKDHAPRGNQDRPGLDRLWLSWRHSWFSFGLLGLIVFFSR